MYTTGLGAAQLMRMYEAGLGVGGFSPQITAQPQPLYTFAGASPQMSVTVGGTTPLAYQWQLNGTNLVNNAYFSGVTNSTLTISNVTAYDVGAYDVLITNLFGRVTSSNAALVILPPALVGQWLNGTNSLTDVSGYSPAGTHDGYVVGGTSYAFTNDVPPNRPAPALWLPAGTTAIAIKNSSTVDANYTNTFDNPLQKAFTLTFWAKGFPSSWNYLVSKNGDSGSPESGWTLRRQGYYSSNNPCWTLRSPSGTLLLGADSYGTTDDMGTSTMNLADGNWHFYAGTYTRGGNRSLYVDGVLVAQETGEGAYNLPSAEHLVIGGIDDSPGNNFGGYFTGEFYDVRLYNYALTLPQLNAVEAPPQPTLTTHVVPGANGNPGQFVLMWNVGTLLEATNLTGVWTRTTNSSPFTNGLTAPLLFFRVSNP
jgi:hypothetical protein